MSDEPTLLERVGGGEAAAVPLLLDRYGSLVWSVVRRQVPPHEAEDVVQEIFVEIWRIAHRFDPERASEATFLTTIARRRTIDHRRRVGRRPEVAELPADVPQSSDGVDQLELGDEARAAAEVIEQLQPRQREVLRMAIVDGLTHAQIAQVTRLPLGTVKSHVRRGLARVRSALGADLGETPAGRMP